MKLRKIFAGAIVSTFFSVGTLYLSSRYPDFGVYPIYIYSWDITSILFYAAFAFTMVTLVATALFWTALWQKMKGPQYQVRKRTFAALKFAPGSPRRELLDQDALTSEWVSSFKYVIVNTNTGKSLYWYETKEEAEAEAFKANEHQL